MANAITLFKKYIDKLDEVYKQSAKTAVLDGDNTLVQMGANANEIIIPKISMDGLGDYSRNGGYVDGDVTLTNETVAPLGLHYNFKSDNISQLDMTGAKLSAITHGHSLGYMPSAVLTHILNRIVYPINEKLSPEKIIMEARDAVNELFCDDKHIDELVSTINKAIKLSKNDDEDLKNIKRLGEGWVAEETLAIAIYCSLKYQNDFSKGIVAAVNHSGDSDSTGAVTGNILGALVGCENIDKKWKNNLEIHNVIAEMSEDLC